LQLQQSKQPALIRSEQVKFFQLEVDNISAFSTPNCTTL
jgi:hypothetical protein